MADLRLGLCSAASAQQSAVDVGAGVAGGIVFAWVYIVWRRVSGKRGDVMTALCHSVFNGMAGLFVWLSG
ncbi:hypothetical protein V5738_15850 [Salinisphaera sp. SPP-AMP-43]|uniref:hypothetical protein n=1 Tax=Salinisphaera sp. SPP-AMP-43 TaxID=3121288 RepID=UPI003C6DC533